MRSTPLHSESHPTHKQKSIMKKNITINLYGSLYAIDEDACQLLEQYLANMKAYFAKREGGDEIADDIEHRVAEILSDLKAEGTEAISIEHVQDIIHRIGNPEQMDEESEEATTNSNNAASNSQDSETPPEPPTSSSDDEQKGKKFFAERKLYRDPDDKIIGGVLSGLCKYFGGNDPLPWRIITVLLCLASFSTVGIVYLIAWAIIPQAHTAEERLLMQGRPVNPASINEELMKQANTARNYMSSPEFQNSAHSFMGTLVRIVLFIVQFIMLCIVTSLLLGLFIFVGVVLYAVCSTPTLVNSDTLANTDWIRMMHAMPEMQWSVWGACGFGIAFLSIVLYAIIRWMLKRDNTATTSVKRTMTLAVLAIVAFAAAVSCTVYSCLRTKEALEVERLKENSTGGYLLWNDQRDDLEEEGWTIAAYENCNADGYCITDTKNWTAANSRDDDDDYDYDSQETRCLNFEHDDKKAQPMKVHFFATFNKPAGYYRLAVVGQSNGDRTLAYALTDSFPVKYATVYVPPFTEGRHGNLRNKSTEELARLGLLTDSASSYDAKGLHDMVDSWSYAESDVFYHKGGNIKVGFTNCPEIATHMQPTGRQTSKFSIRSLKMIPVSAPTTSAPATTKVAPQTTAKTHHHKNKHL